MILRFFTICHAAEKSWCRISVNTLLLLEASACIFDFSLSWEEWPQIIVLKGITSCQKSCDRCLTRLQCSVLCHQLAMKSLIHNITATQSSRHRKEVLDAKRNKTIQFTKNRHKMT